MNRRHSFVLVLVVGDERIEEMLRARMRVVGIALSSVVNVMSPEMVVLGGGLIKSLPKLVLPEFEAGLREYLAPEVNESLDVRASKLGGAAGGLGVAYAALEAGSDNSSFDGGLDGQGRWAHGGGFKPR